LSLSKFVADGKVAEQGPEGDESALDANARQPDVDRVADARRPVGRDHGADRTTAADEGGLERLRCRARAIALVEQ
jgi:hypothetical protein